MQTLRKRFINIFVILSLSCVSIARADLGRNQTIYFDLGTHNFYHSPTPLNTGQKIYEAWTGKKLVEITHMAAALTGSKHKIIVINANKESLEFKGTGTATSSPDTSGYSALKAVIEALTGNGISAEVLKGALFPAVVPPASQSSMQAIGDALKFADTITKNAREVAMTYAVITDSVSFPLLTAATWSSWDLKDGVDPVEHFDSLSTAAKFQLSVIASNDSNPALASVAKLAREPFNKKMADAATALDQLLKLRKSYDKYSKEPALLFSEKFIAESIKAVEISGSTFRIDVEVKKKADAKLDFKDDTYSLDLSVADTDPSLFVSVTPLGFTRIVENRFYVDGGVAKEERVVDRFGFDNLGIAFNWKQGSSPYAITAGFVHQWKGLDKVSTENVGIMIGLSRWNRNWGVTLAYVDTPYLTLGANGPVAAVSDIQTRYARRGSIFLGFSIKTSLFGK